MSSSPILVVINLFILDSHAFELLKLTFTKVFTQLPTEFYNNYDLYIVLSKFTLIPNKFDNNFTRLVLIVVAIVVI